MDFSDIEEVKKLNEDSLPENYPVEFYQFYLAFNPSLCYIAEKDNSIIGYVLSKMELDKECVFVHVTSICVAKEFRNLGIGRCLMQAVVDCLVKKLYELEGKFRAYKVSLYVRVSNEEAIRFYESGFGFKKLSVLNDYYSDGENAYEMVLNQEMASFNLDGIRNWRHSA